MKVILAAAIALLLAGCVLPQTTVRTGAAHPSLVVTGAPAGSTLYVDGLAMGGADQFNGKPSVLAVLDGVHQVEVRLGAQVILHEKVFVSAGESHTVTLLPAAKP
jgi:hypothetical protein